MSKKKRGDSYFRLGLENQNGQFDRQSEFSIHKKRWLSSEDLHLIILYLLEEAPKHGYEIIRSIEILTSGFYAPSPGMVYPTLAQLKRSKLATSEPSGTKKLFELTDDGRNVLHVNKRYVVAILEQIKTFGEKMAYFQNQLLQEEQTNERWGGGFGKDNLDLKMEFMKIRRELKLAIYEKVAAPFEERKRVIEVMKRTVDEIRARQHT